MEKVKEQWQYRYALLKDWNTDIKAMDNPKFKSFSDYQKHIDALNKKFNGNMECRLFTLDPKQK